MSLVDLPVKQYPDIVYKKIEVLDIPSTDLRPYFPEINKFIKDALDTENGRILVHCRAGVSRSASAIISFLISEKGLTYAEAFRITKAQRPIIKPNSGFEF